MIETLLQRMALFCRRRYRLVFVVAGVLVVLCAGMTATLRFESDIEFEYYLNAYRDPVPIGSGFCQRRDSTYKLDVSWAWRMHERFKFEISAFHNNRRSTCDNSDFQATGLGSGIALGW